MRSAASFRGTFFARSASSDRDTTRTVYFPISPKFAAYDRLCESVAVAVEFSGQAADAHVESPAL